MTWDVEKANRAIQFFPDVLRLSEGEHANQPFYLEPSQAFIVGSLFGWQGADGYRRFTNAYIEMGKGNGKSPLLGGIGLYMLTADGEMGAECYAAATTRDQAGILFQDAVKMVDASPALSARITKSGNRQVYNLAHIKSGSFFRVVSSEGKGLDGKRPHFVAIDEVHEHPTDVVIEKMRAGTKGRRQALICEITNSGWDRHSICWQHHEYSQKILEGYFEDDAWFAYVCALDACEDCLKEGKTQPDPDCKKCDDWRDEKVWPKTNPLIDVAVTRKYLRQQVHEAEGMTSKEKWVKRLNCCIWTEGDEQWMSKQAWDLNSHLVVDAKALEGETCYAGLDLALTSDLSALVLTFPPNLERRYWAFLPYFWIPEADMRERVNKDHVPYDKWRDRGFVNVTPGEVTDHDFIETQILELSKKYRFAELLYDPSRATQLVTHLQAAEINAVEFPQTCRLFNVGVLMMEKALKSRTFGHGNHPVFAWNYSNAVTVKNSFGEVKFDKSKTTGRIDGIVAAAMGVRRCEGSIADMESIYETQELQAW